MSNLLLPPPKHLTDFLSNVKGLETLFFNLKIEIILRPIHTSPFHFKINDKIEITENFIEGICVRHRALVPRLYKKYLSKTKDYETLENNLKKLEKPIGLNPKDFSGSIFLFFKICVVVSVHPEEMLSIFENIFQYVKQYRYDDRERKVEDAGSKLQYLPTTKIFIPHRKHHQQINKNPIVQVVSVPKGIGKAGKLSQK